MTKTWFVITAQSESAVLRDICNCSVDDAAALVIGTNAIAEDASKYVSEVALINIENSSIETVASCAADFLIEKKASVVGFATAGVREIAGIVAAKLDCACISNVVNIDIQDEYNLVEHTIVENKVIETLKISNPACLLISPLTLIVSDPDKIAAESPVQVTVIEAKSSDSVALLGDEPIPESGLETKEIVVGIGRGAVSEEAFGLAKQLADKLNVPLSGTRPGVLDFDLFPEGSDYVGVTGARLNSKLYVALGISGCTPHLNGLLNVEKIVCINSDEKANLFNHSDYGIVGPVEEVVPALIKALG